MEISPKSFDTLLSSKYTGQHNGMHQVSKTSDGKGSTPLACANIMDLSYSWCVRWTENPKDRARFPEGPQTW